MNLMLYNFLISSEGFVSHRLYKKKDIKWISGCFGSGS